MKNFIALVVFVVVLSVTAIFVSGVNVTSAENFLTYSFCDKPILYRVDTVDAKFGLSRDEFLADINKAAGIWNSQKDKDLFVYDPKGDLSINLIYDERQFLTSQIGQLENRVQSGKDSLNPQIAEFKKLSAEFKQKAVDLNKDIDFWNSQGGAPPEEYEKLIQRQKDLQTEAENLNAMVKKLNISAEEYNTEVNTLNQTIDTFNSALAERPEEGIFRGRENRIEIYFNINQPELIHTLAHELGHAVGIRHVSNPAAIMYTKTSSKTTLTKEDLSALADVCKRYTVLELLQTRFIQAAAYYQQLLKI